MSDNFTHSRILMLYLAFVVIGGLSISRWYTHNKQTTAQSELNDERRQYLKQELQYESMLDDTDLPGFFHVFYEDFGGDTVYLEVTYTVDAKDGDVVDYTLTAAEWSTRPDTLVQPLAARLVRLYEQCK